MATIKVLNLDGVTTLWSKIKGMFVTKEEQSSAVQTKFLRTRRIESYGPTPEGESDNRLFIGDTCNYDYDDFENYGVRHNNAQITIDNIAKSSQGDSSAGSVSIMASSIVGLNAQSVKLYSDIQSHIYANRSVAVSVVDRTKDTNNKYYISQASHGLYLTRDKVTLNSTDTGLFFNENVGSTKSCLVTKTGFAMGMATGDVTANSNMGNPGGTSGTCAFYFDKSKTLIGCSNTADTRNVVEIQKGTVRVRANGTSLLKASTDTSYARYATKTGCVAAYQNLYVVNPDNDVPGFKVETNESGYVITTIGDKRQKTSDFIRIEYGGHTYSLDIVKLEDDGYLQQID